VPLLIHESADVIQVAVQNAGITTALRVAEMADAFGLSTALVNCPGRFAAHVAAALPNHLMMEVVGAGSDAVFNSDLRIEDGAIVLGDRPGIGITFDEERLAAHTVDQPSAATLGGLYRRSVDSVVHEVAVPGLVRDGSHA
jgi:L-alanine-DL-glutamate epimerase-like enolase superfamily enzyme